MRAQRRITAIQVFDQVAENTIESSTRDGEGAIDSAFRQIQELIVNGQLAPGSWLLEVDLVRRLGLSRTPIRAALQWLEREGFVVHQRHGAKSHVLVAPLTPEDAKELYSLLSKLEGEAASLAAQLPDLQRKVLADELRSRNEQLMVMSDASDLLVLQSDDNHTANQQQLEGLKQIYALDREFHQALIEAASGPRLIIIHRSIRPQVERYRKFFVRGNRFAIRWSEHAKIIDAIEAGDAEEATHLMEDHWRTASRRIASLVEVFGIA